MCFYGQFCFLVDVINNFFFFLNNLLFGFVNIENLAENFMMIHLIKCAPMCVMCYVRIGHLILDAEIFFLVSEFSLFGLGHIKMNIKNKKL